MVNSEWEYAGGFESVPIGFAEDSGERRIHDYRDLIVWREGVALAKLTYELSRKLPREEVFALTSQMRRAAISVPANIAEGFGRETTPAFINHLRIAQGSLKELETLGIVAQEVGHLASSDSGRLQDATARIGKMLRAYIRSLQNRSEA